MPTKNYITKFSYFLYFLEKTLKTKKKNHFFGKIIFFFFFELFEYNLQMVKIMIKYLKLIL
jgi:hypothetical protein